MLGARMIRLSPKAHRFPTGFMGYPAASRHAVFWMLIALPALTSDLDIGRWMFLLRFATPRQVSACHAEAFGEGGLGVFFFFPM